MFPASSGRLCGLRRSAVLAGLPLAALGLGALDARAEAASLPTPALAPATAGESWLSPTVAAGTTWRGAAVITNTAPVARQLRLYAVDAHVLEGGAFAPAAEGGRRAAGRWISLSARRLAIAPGQSRRIGVRIRVPAATKPGVHLAALVAHDALGRSPAAGVRVVDRGALRVYVTVTAACPLARPGAVASTRRGTRASRAFLRALGYPHAMAARRSPL